VGFSLLSSCVMSFTHSQSVACREYLLLPGSVMIQSKEVRYNWRHGIVPSRVHTHKGVAFSREYRISVQLSDFEPSFFEHSMIRRDVITTIIPAQNRDEESSTHTQ